MEAVCALSCDEAWGPSDCTQRSQFSRSGSMCSSQTLLEVCTGQRCAQTSCTAPDSQRDGSPADDASDAFCASSAELGSWACAHEYEQDGDLLEREPGCFPSRYQQCVDMIRHHKLSEAPLAVQTSLLADGAILDDGSRLIVVSWMVEVAEEFGLQQETLHAAVSLLDRFLATSNGVPRCVLQLVAVGCIFLAAKQLEVHHPSVEQMVAVAAHSFAPADLLRVERILLDALDFNTNGPTAYAFLHLLTQATIAAGDATEAGRAASSPAMEVVVSLAMFLTELALLDQSCLAHPGSHLATGALLLAHATLSGSHDAWAGVLSAAGLTQAQVAPALAALSRLHVAALLPPTAQLAELLLPLKAKFGQECWCRVASDVTPLALQQQQQLQPGSPAAQAALRAGGPAGGALF